MTATQSVTATPATGIETTPSLPIIPQPASAILREGAFRLEPMTVLWADHGAVPEASWFSDELAPAMGQSLKVREAPTTAPLSRAIVFRLDPGSASRDPESYRLEVTPDLITVSAPKPQGIFYACQTLIQLLPPEALGRSGSHHTPWSIPCCVIEDKPRFAWRGHLFDVSRHFFSITDVKRALDFMALHKLNRLHWHLTDDQGWRIEIKRYPKLTQVGAWRTDKAGMRYGGFYSQDQIREIVDYAAQRHITIVPEIELPGHSTAALASYPELGCTGGPYSVPSHGGIFKDVFCAGNDQTFGAIENILDEVIALFPSQWIHIGGDECPKDRWQACPHCQARIRAEGLKDEHELQSYFIRRISRHLTERGRTLVGWDEIMEGGLAAGAIVQSWRGIQGGIDAASAGHDVIMSPTSHCYLDYTYEAISLEKCHGYEPVPEGLPEAKAHHILGLEGNLWAENVPDMASYERQTYPRLTALAEVAWAPQSRLAWDDFRTRMTVHEERLRVLGVRFGR